MKTNLVILSFLISIPLISQIPNASFENWESENSWEKPVHWQTNNAEMGFVSVTKVESLTDGDFAMKVESKGPSFEGYAPGIAQSTFIPNTSFNTLELSYKVDSIEGGGNIEIVVSQYDRNTFLQIGYWERESITTGIESLQIPLNPINADSIKIEVRANSQLTALGYEGHAELIVDKLVLSLTSSIINPSTYDEIVIYPNPTNRNVAIRGVNNMTPFQLYNFEGRLIKSGFIHGNKIGINNSGIYNLKLQLGDDWVVKKVVVKK